MEKAWRPESLRAASGLIHCWEVNIRKPYDINDSNKVPYTVYLEIRQKCAESKYVDVFQKDLPLGGQSTDQDPFLCGSDGATLGKRARGAHAYDEVRFTADHGGGN